MSNPISYFRSLGPMRLAFFAVAIVALLSAWFIPDAREVLAGIGASGVVMGGCAPVNLGAALNAAGMCPAMPVPRDWTTIDKVPVARAAPGREFFVDFTAIPTTDTLGRFAFIRALRFKCKANITIAGATNDAVSAYRLRSLFSAMTLTDIGGHEYLSAIEGRDIIDDQFFRGGAYRLRRPLSGAIAENAGAGDIEPDCTLVLDFVSEAPGASPFEGLLSVAALVKKGTQAMRVRLATAIAGAPAGLALTGFERDDGDAGIDVQADIVYLSEPVIDAAWSLRNYTDAQLSGNLQNPGDRHEYVVALPRAEDATPDVTGIEGITVQVAAFPVMVGATQVDSVARDLALEESEPGSAQCLGIAALDLPNDTVGNARRSLIIVPPRAREHAPAGPVVFKFNTAGGAEFTRYLHRSTGCDSAARASKIKAAITDAPCGVCQVVQGGIVNGVVDPTAPKILRTK